MIIQNSNRANFSLKYFLVFATFLFSGCFLVSSSASAATYYVATTGNDSVAEEDNSRLNPWLTLNKAETAASNNDTVHVAAGTYAEVKTTQIGLDSDKAITWIADGAVTVTGPTIASSRVLDLGGTTATSFSGFTFDGQGSTDWIVYAANINNKTFTNCTFQNSDSYAIIFATGSGVSNNTISNSTITVSTGGIFSINLVGLTVENTTISVGTGTFLLYPSTNSYSTMPVNITDSTITMGGAASNISFQGSGALNFDNNNITISSGTPGRFLFSATDGKTGTITFQNNHVTSTVPYSGNMFDVLTTSAYSITFDNNNITLDSASQSGDDIIYLRDQVSPVIEGNTIETTTSNSAPHIVLTSTGTDCGTPSIRNNTLKTRSQTGYGISVGSEAHDDNSNNKFDGTIITGNTVYGPYYYNNALSDLTIHGIHWGFSINAVMAYNTIIGMPYGFAIEGNPSTGHETPMTFTSGGVYNNLIIDSIDDDGAILAGGFNSLPIYNNTIYTISNSANLFKGISYGDGGYTGTATAKNNIIYQTDGKKLIQVGQSSDDILTSDYNLFWNTTGSGMDFKIYNNSHAGDLSTNYSSLDEWKNATAAEDGTRYNFDVNSISADPLFANPNSDPDNNDFFLLYTSAAIDAGTDVGLITDKAGNPIYGTPDIGAYEYQPPYTMGTNEITTSAAVRMYGDEKFRNKSAPTGGDTADLEVAISGSDKTDWLDITITDWQTSGTYAKAWTESSDINVGDTEHTIGNLKANTYYNVSLDTVLGDNITGCTAGVCLSNSSGQITFTYTGGYSSHNFTVEEQAAAPAAQEISSPQIKTDGNNYEKPSKSTNYVNDSTQKFKGKDSALANGTIKIYKGKSLYKTITASATGAWKATIKKLKDKAQTLKFRFYSSTGTLLDTYKRIFKLDAEKPQFTRFINLRQVAIPGITKYDWEATDNRQIAKYKIYFNGRIKTTKTPSFKIPTNTPRGWHNLRIKALDKAGNETVQSGDVWVR